MKANKENHYGYNRNLKGLARALRGNMTKAESCLWKFVLKGRQMKGYQFRRQRPVLSFIADFMCKELDLIIEVDGITHQYEDVVEKDRKREEELKQAGFHVMRFDDEEVLNHINNVYQEIEEWIEEYEKRSSP